MELNLKKSDESAPVDELGSNSDSDDDDPLDFDDPTAGESSEFDTDEEYLLNSFKVNATTPQQSTGKPTRISKKPSRSSAADDPTEPETRKRKTRRDLKPSFCDYCQETLDSEKKLREHTEVHQNVSNFMNFFPCTDCSIMHLTKQQLDNHNNQTHPEKNPENFDEVLNVRFDAKQTDGSAYSCAVCEKVYEAVDEMKKHIILHVIIFFCPFFGCVYQHDELNELGIHILKEHLYVRRKCKNCETASFFRSFFDLRNHMQNDCKTSSYVCSKCGKIFSTSKNLRKHLQNIHNPKSVPCQFCGKLFLSHYMKRHLRVHNGENIKQFPCLICNKSFTRAVQIKRHMAVHTERPFDFCCTQCTKKFQTPRLLKIHEGRHTIEKKKHEEYAEFISKYMKFSACHQCLLVFLTPATLLQHTKEKHPEIDDTKTRLVGDDLAQTDEKDRQLDPEQAYACAVCNYRDLSDRDVKNHLILTHFASFACPFVGCGHAYDALRRLIQHMNEKHINDHKCKYCKEESATFETEEDLKQHHENDCLAPRQECDHCDKKFLSKDAFYFHRKSILTKKNEGEAKKYICQFCSKAHETMFSLKMHERVHTGEMPFPCTVCNKTFRTSGSRLKHMDMHIEGKTFQCPVCFVMFQTGKYRKEHMSRKHPETKQKLPETENANESI